MKTEQTAITYTEADRRTAVADYKRIWALACASDGISPDRLLDTISRDNPYRSELRIAGVHAVNAANGVYEAARRSSDRESGPLS